MDGSADSPFVDGFGVVEVLFGAEVLGGFGVVGVFGVAGGDAEWGKGVSMGEFSN